MSVPTDPNALVTAVSSGCYSCIPKGMENEVIIYLLNQILGTGLTPQQLMDGAACMKCITGLMQQDVILYLLDQISGGGGGGCTYQDMQVAWEPGTLKLGEMIGFFTYGDLPGITKIQFLGTTSIAGFDIESTAELLELDFPNLASIDSGNLQFGYALFIQNSGLANINFPSLVTSHQIYFNQNALTILSIPTLVSINANGGSALRIVNENGLTSIDFGSLNSVNGDLQITGTYTVLTSINLTSLQSCVNCVITIETASPVLTSLSLPNLVSVDQDIDIDGNPQLSTLSIPSLIPTNGSALRFNNNALDATSVELALRRCVLAGVTTCTIDISGGTNTGLAALSAQGQADYAALVVAGNTVTLNP